LTTAAGQLARAVQGTSSNDSGDITWTVPHGRVSFPSNVPGVRGHHWAAAIATATSIAHKGEVAGAKMLAASIVDLLAHPGLLDKAKKSLSRRFQVRRTGRRRSASCLE
jgi:aminobenzoyl-glutamate utilization protein B